ncbi:hypothetical protein [Vibrio parahaemolyticus]|uniref:hypothetical protein n=1 Tax=Vibrio parahaemolyticus TaxID=670 RepID=UPI0011218121|nr:hypothetical protein [Vibrio parahaemolyticus]MDF4308748.1 hypothetical protein [Vibrio parahaemolyticus]TNZ94616.1 hypothetical protein CGK37_06190 [Vibrio parahaemolyticus]TOA14692.1 hypothetical protein CGK34_08840 [Vibrio parahaemolyticus]HBH7883345.1 hypothetical protein [Vibrio parahaemolyticus]
MKHSLLLSLLLPVCVSAQSLEEVTKQVIHHEDAYNSSYTYTNFYTLKFEGKNEYTTKINNQFKAKTSLYSISLEEKERLQDIEINIILLQLSLEKVYDGETDSIFYSNPSETILTLIDKYTNIKLPSPPYTNGLRVNVTEKEAKTALDDLDKILKNIQNKFATTDYSVEIAPSRSGKQNLYFFWDSKDCVINKEKIDRKVFNVNGQNVNFLVFCETYKDSDKKYISATAASDKGAEFVINQFKLKSWVTLSNIDSDKLDKIKFWANGFTKAWNSAGGDAL